MTIDLRVISCATSNLYSRHIVILNRQYFAKVPELPRDVTDGLKGRESERGDVL